MPAETRTRFFKTGSPTDPVRLRGGGQLPGITLAYETWGELNADRSNAIFLFHALSGSHHAAGLNTSIKGVGDLWQPEMHDGWWQAMIGPGKALDTDKYFIICANYLGGCYGSTGPASLNPETGKPWGAAFPAVSAADIHKAKPTQEEFGFQGGVPTENRGAFDKSDRNLFEGQDLDVPTYLRKGIKVSV